MNKLQIKIKSFLKNKINYYNKNLPDLKKIKNYDYLNKKKKIKKLKNQKILIATSSGGLYPHLILESMLGLALNFKGANTEFLLCDGSLYSCIMCTTKNINENDLLENGPEKLCTNCFIDGNNYLKNTKIKVNKFSDYLSTKDFLTASNISNSTNIKKIKSYKFESIPVGEHAFAGALRFYGTTDLDSEPKGKNILKKYFESAILTKLAMDKFLLKNKFDLIIMNHGIYVPQGVINECAKNKKIKIITWHPFYRKSSYCFYRGDTYHKESLTEKNNFWEKLKLTKKKNKNLLSYLESRKTGKFDWKFYYDKPNFDKDSIFKKFKIDSKKPLIGMATNVIWDAQIDYPKQFFNNLLEWIFFTIDFFIKNQNLQLIIRVHPAEVNSDRPPKQKVIDEINKKYKKLPKNIFIVPPEDPLSSYTIFDHCNSVIIYASKIGIELSASGIPVIVVGPGQIKNKKIAYDVNSLKSYKIALNKLPLNKKKYISKNKILRAKKYAYHAFFRKPMFISSVKLQEDRWPNIGIDDNFFYNLVNKKDKGLEFLCDAILNDKNFISDIK